MLDSVNPQNRRFMPVSEVLHDVNTFCASVFIKCFVSEGIKTSRNMPATRFQYRSGHSLCSLFCDCFYQEYGIQILCKKLYPNRPYRTFQGINFQSVFNGINLITSIDQESPAERCKKLNAGDEILEVISAQFTRKIIISSRLTAKQQLDGVTTK